MGGARTDTATGHVLERGVVESLSWLLGIAFMMFLLVRRVGVNPGVAVKQDNLTKY